MGSAERFWRDLAAALRTEEPTQARPRRWLDDGAVECEAKADQLALFCLDLRDLFAPTAGDALALRGGVLVEAGAI